MRSIRPWKTWWKALFLLAKQCLYHRTISVQFSKLYQKKGNLMEARVGIEPRVGLRTRKLFILRNAKKAKNAQIAEVGYTAGTRKSEGCRTNCWSQKTLTLCNSNFETRLSRTPRRLASDSSAFLAAIRFWEALHPVYSQSEQREKPVRYSALH